MLYIKYFTLCFLVVLLPVEVYSQTYKGRLDPAYIQETLDRMYTPEYLSRRQALIDRFAGVQPGRFGEFISGVCVSFETGYKEIALTFDACVGGMDDYNAPLIELLRKEKIPATLFVTGSWIDAHPEVIRELAADTLFEIGNHGLFHRVCSANGRSAYNIQPTLSLSEVIDEMELNAIRIERLTGERPRHFRSATAFIDEASVRVANALGMQVVNYDILSGDAIPNTPAKTLCDNIVQHAHPGAIVIMHFNHPQRQEKEALELVIPLLRSMGYRFVRLGEVKLIEK